MCFFFNNRSGQNRRWPCDDSGILSQQQSGSVAVAATAAKQCDQPAAETIHLQHPRRRRTVRQQTSRAHPSGAEGVQQSADSLGRSSAVSVQVGEDRAAQVADAAEDTPSRTAYESFGYPEGAAARHLQEGREQDRDRESRSDTGTWAGTGKTIKE